MARYVETYRGVVYPWLCDQMGHCNVQHYMAMYDQASVHLFLEIGLTPSLLDAQQLGFADVRHEIEYKAEMRVGAAIRGESRVLSIGKSSFRHEHRLLDAETLHSAGFQRQRSAESLSVHRLHRQATPLWWKATWPPNGFAQGRGLTTTFTVLDTQTHVRSRQADAGGDSPRSSSKGRAVERRRHSARSGRQTAGRADRTQSSLALRVAQEGRPGQALI